MATKKRILVVEDEEHLAEGLRINLELEGYEPVLAGSAEEAWRLWQRSRADLILLDVMLPGMDGWEVCARLRELTDLPIIMLTAKATEADKLRGFQLGVDDYVTKPFSFAELVARVRAVLGRLGNDHKEEGYVAHGEIVLDMEKYQASLAGRTLDLTPTEFRLLEVLVRRKGKVVSDKELINEVWGEIRTDPALVRRYILMLRRKLETDPSNPVWLRTARGFGYRLGTGPLKPPEDDSGSTKE
jgi:DNA-binding response OmpR family regulator